MELLHIVSQQYIYLYIYQKNCPISIFKFSIKNDFSTQTLALPKNHVKIFKNQTLNIPTQTPIQQTTFHWYTSFTKFCTFSDMEPFLHPYPIFSTLPNLNFLTSWTQKFQLYQFLPCALSPTQNKPKEPKRFWINPYLDHKTAVHILLEDAAHRCFDLACLSLNRATHLKSPKNCGDSVFSFRLVCLYY